MQKERKAMEEQKKEIKVGIAGLGRQGKVQANNICFKIPGAKLTAACSVIETELKYAQNELGVSDVYTDYEEMLKKADIDAVAIVTTSGEHCRQIEAALAAGKHVFCEKPLGVNAEECKRVERAIEQYPNQVFFLGFMRRYDPSYAYAMQKVKEGAIGKPYLVKATGIDPESLVEGTIKFCGTSGGIYIDMASHDIDLMRWFLGEEVTEVYALGCTFKHPEFEENGDCETGCAIFRFKNGAMGQIHVGRTAAHGYHVETEIVGTEGSIRVSPVPQKNLTMIYDKNGAVVECVGSFPERFADAFLLELKEFISCIREGRKPDVTVYDGIKATEVAYAAAQSLREHRPIQLNTDTA